MQKKMLRLYMIIFDVKISNDIIKMFKLKYLKYE